MLIIFKIYELDAYYIGFFALFMFAYDMDLVLERAKPAQQSLHYMNFSAIRYCMIYYFTWVKGLCSLVAEEWPTLDTYFATSKRYELSRSLYFATVGISVGTGLRSCIHSSHSLLLNNSHGRFINIHIAEAEEISAKTGSWYFRDHSN